MSSNVNDNSKLEALKLPCRHIFNYRAVCRVDVTNLSRVPDRWLRPKAKQNFPAKRKRCAVPRKFADKSEDERISFCIFARGVVTVLKPVRAEQEAARAKPGARTRGLFRLNSLSVLLRAVRTTAIQLQYNCNTKISLSCIVLMQTA